MGEFLTIIKAVKKDKNKFYLLMNKMEPLINKYVRLLYKDDKEDVKSELLFALWEAVCDISYYKNEGQVVNFLYTALRNRYLKLYRSSKRIHEYEILMDNEQKEILQISYFDNDLDNIIFNEEKYKLLNLYKGTKKNIVYLIIIENLSDIEIAKQLKLSRQYINRIRRMLQMKTKKDLLK